MKPFSMGIVGLALGLVAGCGQSNSPDPSSSQDPSITPVTIKILSSEKPNGLVALAVSPPDVTSITVEVTAPDIDPPITATITPTPGQDVTVTMDIPAGSGRIFTSTAYDAGGIVRYRGQTIADIPGGSPITISIILVSVDSSPPQVLFVDPPIGAGDVPVNVTLSARFSEALDATTVNGDTFTLMPACPTNRFCAQVFLPVLGTVSYDPATRTAIFDPTSNLNFNTLYTATLTTGVKDLSGNALVQAYAWSFTTHPDTGVDLSFPPVITTVRPANNATAVSVRAPITATFNADMNAASLNTSTFQLQNQGGFVTGTISYDAASKTVTFTPNADLAFSTLYAATVTSAATDTTGQAMGQDYTWTFTTAAIPPPTKPTGLTATPGDGQVTLEWNPNPSNENVTSYNLFMAPAHRSGFPVVAGPANDGPISVYFVDGNDVPFGSFELDAGEAVHIISITDPTETTGVAVGVEVITGTITVTVNGETVTLEVSQWHLFTIVPNWANVLPGATQQSGIGCCTFNQTGLANGTGYLFAVTAVNAGGESTQSSPSWASPPAGDLGTPLPPADFTATANGNQINLTWSASTGASYYKIYHWPGGIEVATVTTTSYTDTGLAPGTTYTYTVTACDAGGDCSIYSTPASATTAPTAPP